MCMCVCVFVRVCGGVPRRHCIVMISHRIAAQESPQINHRFMLLLFESLKVKGQSASEWLQILDSCGGKIPNERSDSEM